MRYRGCVAVLLLLLVLAGCGQGADRGPIDNVNDLEGRRVGVNLAWEADYLLTGREDMELYRYDSTADMLMALNYGKLDAIAVDDTSLRLVLSQVTGLEVVEPALAVGVLVESEEGEPRLQLPVDLLLQGVGELDPAVVPL